MTIDITALSKDAAMTTLIGTEGLSYSEAVAYWKEHGSKASVGFAARFYELLRNGPMDDPEFEELIKAASSNVQRHKGHYDAIRLLTIDIHNQ